MATMKVRADKETLQLITRAYSKMNPGGGVVSMDERASYVLRALLEQWDTTEEMFREGAESTPAQLSGDVESLLRTITEPDIGLKVKVRHDRTTPRSTDNLVPWDYVLAGYSALPFITDAEKDYTDRGEQRVLLIRTVLTRIPEDQWESEQTRSIVAKALSQVI